MNQPIRPARRLSTILVFATAGLIGCATSERSDSSTPRAPTLPAPIAGARAVDGLIEPTEKHFAHLWQVTFGGQNAEGYWSFAGDRLTYQFTNDTPKTGSGWSCDRIFTTDPSGAAPQQLSSGRGVTTCSYFMPGDREVLFASTQQWQETCPPKADHSQGYTWMLHPEYDLWVKDLASGAERRIIEDWGYDAEATVAPAGDRIVFTSTRSGDVELWTCNLEGGDLKQVTHKLGYDGGAFFSHNGKQLVFRSTAFGEEKRAEEENRYRELLSSWKVRPQAMDLYVCNVDGSERRQVTHLGGASFAPYFFPNDQRIVFSTNHHEASQRNFDLFAIGVDGQELERITTFAGFDCFPMFTPDGRFMAFASNRGGSVAGETNLFVAQWQ